MKRNVNVFIAVVLVAVLCGGVVWLRTADDEKLGWNIHDTYGDAPAYSGGAAYTNATFAGPANDGGVMTLSPSRTMRHGAVSSSYAGAYAISYGVSSASSPNSLIASSPLTSAPTGGGLYTTSSKTFNSYGGGGNGGAAMGGAISNGRSNSGLSNPSLQGGAGVGSISPIAYSTARRGEMSSAAGDNPAQMLAENPAMAMTNAASVGNGFYGFGSVVDYSASANNTQYSGMFGGNRSNVRGKQNAVGMDEAWWIWLDKWLVKDTDGDGVANGADMGNGDKGADGYYTEGYGINQSDLDKAYEDFKNWCWNQGMAVIPSKEQWYEWYYSTVVEDHNGWYEFNGHYYFWTPVGDILPLLLIALLYVLFVAIKSKSLKSLLKTERSE